MLNKLFEKSVKVEPFVSPRMRAQHFMTIAARMQRAALRTIGEERILLWVAAERFAALAERALEEDYQIIEA